MNPGNLSDTLPKLLCRNAREHRDEVALREKEARHAQEPAE